MAYNEKLAGRVRELLSEQRRVVEKNMMGGLTFMVNDKMCVGILNDDLMVRIGAMICTRLTIPNGALPSVWVISHTVQSGKLNRLKSVSFCRVRTIRFALPLST